MLNSLCFFTFNAHKVINTNYLIAKILSQWFDRVVMNRFALKVFTATRKTHGKCFCKQLEACTLLRSITFLCQCSSLFTLCSLNFDIILTRYVFSRLHFSTQGDEKQLHQMHFGSINLSRNIDSTQGNLESTSSKGNLTNEDFYNNCLY
jgi:hypothetical protein